MGTRILDTEKIFHSGSKPDWDDDSIPSISFAPVNFMIAITTDYQVNKSLLLHEAISVYLQMCYNSAFQALPKSNHVCTEPHFGFIAGISFSGGLAFARAGRIHIPYDLHLIVSRLEISGAALQ